MALLASASAKYFVIPNFCLPSSLNFSDSGLFSPQRELELSRTACQTFSWDLMSE